MGRSRRVRAMAATGLVVLLLLLFAAGSCMAAAAQDEPAAADGSGRSTSATGYLPVVMTDGAAPTTASNPQALLQQGAPNSTAAESQALPRLARGAAAVAMLDADGARRAELLAAAAAGPSREWGPLRRAIVGDPGLAYDTSSNQLLFACGGHTHAWDAAATGGPAALSAAGEVVVEPPVMVAAAGGGSAAVAARRARRKRAAKCAVLNEPASAFELHSRAESLNKILLDFTGHTTQGTAWNEGRAASIVTPPYAGAADATSMSAEARAAVIAIWRGVSEDLRPFDVDVTTQEDGLPAPALRVVFGGRGDWLGLGLIGGAAYLGSYGNASAQPVFVFTGAGSMAVPKMAWEAASHYIGHALGLLHKGLGPGKPLYTGHGDWAPIMGLSYYRNVTQWSRGEYDGADNTDDEVAALAARLPLLPTPTAPTAAGAALLPFEAGADGLARALQGAVMSRPEKTHYWAFTPAAPGPVNITVTPAPAFCNEICTAGQGNLDIRLELLRGGAVLATSEPDGVPAELGASVTFSADASMVGVTHVVAVTAVGSGASNYNDYGSLGAYTLDASWPAASYTPPKRPPRASKLAQAPAPVAPPPLGGVASTFAPRIVIVPGITLCNVETRAFYGWLRDELHQRPPLFLDVTLRRMPACSSARESVWIPFMRDELRAAEDTVIVGHSSGAIAAMRFAQKYKVAGIVLVATYNSTLGLAMEERSEYFRTAWDWSAIRANAGFIIQFASTSDPWLGQGRGRPTGWSEQMDVAKKLNAELHILDRGHFMKKRVPELLDAIQAKLTRG
ncbi:MAG: hypothetical protein J3K34DRAFT_443854 [Monoraphidium minutum]|nr:MAG: hypothetical protein J3K34DRAFT_443854 [Monoraphidium minutum]